MHRRSVITRAAQFAGDEDAVRALFVEYAGYAEGVGASVCTAGLARELTALPGEYASPGGRVILAERAAPTDGLEPSPGGDRLAGIVALRPLTQATCEMKRLYVRPAFRGEGAGAELALAAIAAGKAIGYDRLVLDTLPAMTRAVALYRALGFHQIARYNDNHHPGTLFFERRLV